MKDQLHNHRKHYPGYKPSGSEWLGEVPVHWSTVRLRWGAQIYSGGTPDTNNQEYWTDGSIAWINSGAVNQILITEPTRYITKQGYVHSSAKWVNKGALVMALAGQGKTKATIAQLNIDSTINQSLAAISTHGILLPRFVFWWLTCNYLRIRNLAGDELRDGLNLDMIGSIQCPYLPIDEQRSIAIFLDRETAQIDTLIEKKKRQIELLKEKRTALISHTVTKGLDPNVKMKPSGIEWLGEVPEHWEVKSLGWHIKLLTGFAFKSELFSFHEGVRLVRGDNVTEGHLRWDEKTRYWNESLLGLEDLLLQANDILIGMDGSKVGKNYAIVSTKDLPLLLVQRVARLRVDDYLNYRFLLYLIGSDLFKTWVELVKTDPAIPHISPADINGYPIPVPPLPEQLSIASFLDGETARIDSHIQKIETSIELLKEYRTALISEAVTGKIDVRQEQ